VYNSSWNPWSQSYGAPPARCDHAVSRTPSPTLVNAPRLNSSQQAQYLIYLPRRKERLSWPWRLVVYQDWLPVRRQLPSQVLGRWWLTGSGIHDLLNLNETLHCYAIFTFITRYCVGRYRRLDWNRANFGLWNEPCRWQNHNSWPCTGRYCPLGIRLVSRFNGKCVNRCFSW